MDIRRLEAEKLAKRLYEIQVEMERLKVLEKECRQIKERLKEIYPVGGVEKFEDVILEVKRVEYTTYDVPMEIKEQYKGVGYRYNIEVKKVV